MCLKSRKNSSLLKSICLGITALALSGCAAPKPRVCTYVSELQPGELPNRIVVVPFSSTNAREEASPLVTEAFALEIQRILCKDVIIAPADDARLLAESEMTQRGRVDIESLIESRKKYLADAFLFGTVTQYKPYDPPILGVNLCLMSATTGEVTWAAGGLFDAKDADVRQLGESYYNNSSLRKDLYGPEMLFMSPRLYAGFVAERVLAPLDDLVRKKERKASNIQAKME